MPNHEEHCQHSLELYGVRADDVHTWMDEPSSLYGSSHRWTRHDLALIPRKFIDEYGEELTRQIMLDHILLDRQWEVGPSVRITATAAGVKVFSGPRDPVKPALISFTVWGFGLVTLFITHFKPSWYVGLWVMSSLLWWPLFLPMWYGRRKRKQIEAAEEAIREQHR